MDFTISNISENCRMSRVNIVVVLIVAIFSIVRADIFQNLDSNADGALDRAEFRKYLKTVHDAVDPLIVMDQEAADAFAVKAQDKEWLEGVLSMSSSNGFSASFLNSLAVILITEIGDKTFFIAAVLAMRNHRFPVYAGCMLALAVMHVLSSFMGFALPALLPKMYTHYASIILFLYFGYKLLQDAYDSKGEGPSEELHEVEEELNAKEEGCEPNDDEEAPPLTSPMAKKDLVDAEVTFADTLKNLLLQLRLVEKKNLEVFFQALTLTFVAEWGDRSQIATIALGSVKDVVGVILGGLIGHAFCTGLAVVGGRMLAAKISERTVAIVGGVGFLGFGVHAFLVGP